MATAAFRSSTRRSTFVDDAAGDASSSNRGATVRRSRSLSRFSDRLPPPAVGLEQDEPPRLEIRPSNNSSGFVFPEISLDDLAHEFFLGRYKDVDIIKGDAHRRRGRSVSRCAEPQAAGESNTFSENGRKNRGTSCSRLRRQRSLSMARQRFTDSEDFSSTFADVEVRNAPPRRKVSEKINGAVSASGKTKIFKSNGHRSGLREAMTNEERLSVEEIQTKLEQSDKRKEVLLAKLAVEQQRNQELSKIVKNLHPGQKSACMARTHSCVRRRSKDKLSISKHLMEEAEKHIDEFLSNIEDADISSFDGDRSDTSSTIGGNSKCRDPVTYNTIEEIHENLVSPAASPVDDSEGILLPWLHLETSNEGSSSPCKTTPA
ncbi:uncharacterized protein LOC110100472 isoform X2 [Dendrobium catenatum]|uniref:Uncharacterized protein n=1 Tax=Dendrobium catenatum TaxID=906689 RepID=A0A2I0XAP2_9ASPA|nr:uncharacterized protein LOC110100472 isoform X2 [Dendrobium catenatum]PKU84983.1 hypothetical protein MA16_Dca015199 [Dendrobium catenatum]